MQQNLYDAIGNSLQYPCLNTTHLHSDRYEVNYRSSCYVHFLCFYRFCIFCFPSNRALSSKVSDTNQIRFQEAASVWMLIS